MEDSIVKIQVDNDSSASASVSASANVASTGTPQGMMMSLDDLIKAKRQSRPRTSRPTASTMTRREQRRPAGTSFRSSIQKVDDNYFIITSFKCWYFVREEPVILGMLKRTTIIRR